MAEKKRKFKENNAKKKNKKQKKNENGLKKKGPRLPSQLQREIKLLNPNPKSDASDSEASDGISNRFDVYEYDESIPEEESKKNRRYDSVENFEYHLPDDFKDENVPSDDDDVSNKGDSADDSLDEEVDGDDDNVRHTRMLQEITGMPREVFEGKKKKKVLLDHPQSESDLNRTASNGLISVNDLLDPLHGKPGYSKVRKRLQQLEKHTETLATPLPKVDREKLERRATYEWSKKDITKWEPLVKRNREAPTVFFDVDVDLGYSTVGAIAAEFKPRTEFEKRIASVVYDPEVMEACKQDGARLLELNKVSVEDVKERQSRLAKMRSLLFRHEIKAKRIKKIKSKTYHRMLKKDRLKGAASDALLDPEAAKEYAMKQEFKRAEERMTLKHKNSSKWAKRILKRGLQVQDEGTRAAISEQLQQHALLTRKMNSMKDSSSSDDSSDDDEDDDGTNGEEAAKLFARAKEKTLEVIEDDEEMPKTGVLSLPFMVRGMKKTKEAAYEEAQCALEEYDSSLRQLDDVDAAEVLKQGTSSGRRSFGVAKKESQVVLKAKADNSGRDSDGDEEFVPRENLDMDNEEKLASHKDVRVDPRCLLDDSDVGHEALFKSFDDTVKDPGPKTSYEVAIFASDSWKKIKSDKEVQGSRQASTIVESSAPQREIDGVDHISESESEEEMVDGILSSDGTKDYKLPSQEELIRSAFAADDVEAEFEKEKLEVLNEENPEPEKPMLLPGWGQWTRVQQKKGLPSWMVEEHENAKKKRDHALKKRKDANLKHVIISERIDKKAEKLHAIMPPFPFKSKEVYEQSMRMPIGPEFNPAVSVGALNRPEVVKKPGVIIKPIKFEEVNPLEKGDGHRHGEHAAKKNKNKGAGGKGTKKMNKGKKC